MVNFIVAILREVNRLIIIFRYLESLNQHSKLFSFLKNYKNYLFLIKDGSSLTYYGDDP